MNELIKVISTIANEPVTFNSNFARRYSHQIAEAASRGLITCIAQNLNRGRWLVTPKGLTFTKEGSL